MHRALLSAVLSLSVLLSTLVAAQDASYTFTTIDVPGSITTAADRINDRGQIVGYFHNGTRNRAFLKDGDTYTPIDVPGAISTTAWDIDDRGQIIGSFWDGTRSYGFLATP